MQKKEWCDKHQVARVKNAGRGERLVCRPCRAEYMRKKRKLLKEELVREAGGACSRCGYDRCLRALSFHHRDKKDKSFQISTAFIHSKEKLKKEISKCDILCAKCHMETEETP